MKAWWAQDLTMFEQSVQVNIGYDARKCGQQVQNHDKVGWNKVECAVCCHAMTHKFPTNLQLKKLLIDTGDSVLAKSFTWSKEWGIGCNADDTRSNHSHTCPGDMPRGWHAWSSADARSRRMWWKTNELQD